MNRLLLLTGIFLLFAVEILHVYFIMPFPGSQRHDTIAFAWFIGRNIVWLRLSALMLLFLFYPLYNIPAEGTLKGAQLQPVQRYQEFLHSWEYFHPGTERYGC